MSHNYSDIGTIENTRCTDADAITSDKQRRINGFVEVRGTLKEADGKCISFVTSDLSLGQDLHVIYESRCSKISFCSTVARIGSFQVNNKPVGYTSTNTPGLVNRLSFSWAVTLLQFISN